MWYWGNESEEEDENQFELLGRSIEYYRIVLGALFIFIALILFQNAQS